MELRDLLIRIRQGCLASVCAVTEIAMAYLDEMHQIPKSQWHHINVLASQITRNSIVYSTVCSDVQQRKHTGSSMLLALCMGNTPMTGRNEGFDLLCWLFYYTLPSAWVSSRLKFLETRLFVWQLVQYNNIKAVFYWPFVRGSTVETMMGVFDLFRCRCSS